MVVLGRTRGFLQRKYHERITSQILFRKTDSFWIGGLSNIVILVSKTAMTKMLTPSLEKAKCFLTENKTSVSL